MSLTKSRITSIEQIDSGETWDISNFDKCLNNEGNFIANGIIIHNCIPEYIKRRDDTNKTWLNNEHPEVAEMLMDTHGIIVYQEQLQALWMKFGGFTAPEAEAARKAVAKKWTHKLKGIEEQWIKGASKTIGEEWARYYFKFMLTFGRYAFNKSHSCSYIMVAYWCAWLKAHFPEEWWASVMSACHPDRLVTYMNVARAENVKFGSINIEKLSASFTVDSSNLVVTPGLASIKGIGKKTADQFVANSNRSFSDIDEFIEVNGKSKTVLERLIKLGAFERYHPNSRALWLWYQYKYASGKDITKLRKDTKQQLLLSKGWTKDVIEEKRKSDITKYFKDHPKRNKLPPKLVKEKYEPHIECDRNNIMSLRSNDYTLTDRLNFESEFLGYWWHNPMDVFPDDNGSVIQHIKEYGQGTIRCILKSYKKDVTKTGKDMIRLYVTDGMQSSTVFIWEREANNNLTKIRDRLNINSRNNKLTGVLIDVKCNKYGMAVQSGTVIKFLRPIEDA